MSRSQKGAVIALGVIGLLYVGIAVATNFSIDTFITPKIQELSDAIKAHQSKILSDLEQLDKNPIFPDMVRTKDAQDFISKHIGWEGEDAKSLARPEPEELLALSSRYTNFFKSEDLRALSADSELTKVDVSWLDQLESYDHWNLATSPLIKGQLDRAIKLDGIGRIGVFANLALPDFTLLRFVVVARFLQLEKQGEAHKGLRLMRHVSRLLHTTHTLGGAMSAAAVLGSERAVAETFAVQNWSPIEKERIAAYKRVSWAWGGVLHLAMWDKFPSEFQSYLKPSNGVCAMVNEKTLTLGTHEFLMGGVPLERDYSVQLKQSDEWSQKLFTLCSMPQYMAFLVPTKSNSSFNKGKIPFVRRGVGLVILTVGTPNYLGQYGKLEVAPTVQKESL